MPFSGPKYANQKYGNDWFSEKELRILDSPTALLNDTCINGGAIILQRQFSNNNSESHCAIFSMHDLTRIRYKALDQELWKNAKHTEYWMKDVWIIPIHRHCQVHWVLAVAYLQSGEVYLYDSFAGKHQWKNDVPVSFLWISFCLQLHSCIGSISLSLSRASSKSQRIKGTTLILQLRDGLRDQLS